MLRSNGRLDYLKFMFKMEHDSFQAHVVSGYHRALMRCGVSIDNGAVHKLTALGPGADKLPRYIIEIWGEEADKFAERMPASWVGHLRRIDFRFTIGDLTAEQMRSIQRAVSLPGGVKPAQIIDSRPRKKKGESRDVGGVGLYFNSRKSDRHAVVYKRGKEEAAFEFRLRDKKAAEAGENAWRLMMSDTSMSPRDALRFEMALWSEEFERERFSGDVGQWAWAMASAGDKLLAAVEQMEMFAETAEEREFWASMSTEEQLDMQRITVEPTPQGWRESTKAPRPNGGSIEFDETQDDLPF